MESKLHYYASLTTLLYGEMPNCSIHEGSKKVRYVIPLRTPKETDICHQTYWQQRKYTDLMTKL